MPQFEAPIPAQQQPDGPERSNSRSSAHGGTAGEHTGAIESERRRQAFDVSLGLNLSYEGPLLEEVVLRVRPPLTTTPEVAETSTERDGGRPRITEERVTAPDEMGAGTHHRAPPWHGRPYSCGQCANRKRHLQETDH
ncbi:ureidoglycolate hydrolase [Lasius niger]|uniref:Ureidoglycolate hydrolase n=1 Tax=Lasius niger TaxID=67767 RepID=A0A0J7JZS2_LASNI|nr:ureidoglycolate hydrolase [Lasius niger]